MAAMAILPNSMRMLVIALDATRAYESICQWNQNRQIGQRNNNLDQASLVNRLILLGFTISETALLLNAAEADTMSLIKKLEFIFRATEAGIQWKIYEQESEQTNELSSLSKIAMLEKKLLGPLAALERTAHEVQGYNELSYLEAYQKDPTATRPVGVYNSQGHFSGVEPTPINPEECEMLIQKSKEWASYATYFQTAAQMGIFSDVCIAATPLYEKLARFLRAWVPQQEPPGMPTPPQSAAMPSENLSLLTLSRIPPFLFDDIIFSRYICPITQEPIRDPVQDPNGRTLYERNAIYNWLQMHPTSPVTMAPMSIENLKEMPALRALIDARLQFHQEKLEEFLQHQQTAPIRELDLDAQAKLEYTE